MTDNAMNSATARTHILNRLRTAPPGRVTVAPAQVPPPPLGETPYGRFRELLETNRGEVVETTASQWAGAALALLAEKGCRRVLFAPETDTGRQLAAVAAAGVVPDVTLVPYDTGIETLKPTLVHGVDAGVTGSRGAVAATGSVVLWPSAAEPRLMSLLPPIHLAVVKASTLHRTLGELIRAENWAAGMPTNALLISGPSKTADIAQLLAFGVHGPKQLVVMVIQDE